MVRRTPDGPQGSDAGGEAGADEHIAVAATPEGLPPFAEPFVPQFEAIQTVLDRLTGFALVPVEVPSRDVALALGKWLRLKERRVHVVFKAKQWRTLTAAIVADPPGEGGVALVVFPREVSAETRSALRLLNQRRDTVAARLGVPLVWCGNAEFLRSTADLAPDFWSVRDLPLRIQVPVEYAALPDEWQITLENPVWASKPEIAVPATFSVEDLAETETRLRGSRASFQKTGNQAGVIQTTKALARVLERNGRLAEAAALLEGVLHLAAEVDDWQEEAHVLVVLATIQIGQKQFARASESLEKARLRLERLDFQKGLAVLHRLLARLLHASADLEGAASEALRAAHIFERLGDMADAADALVLGSTIRRAQGDQEGALEILRSATNLLGATPEALAVRMLVEATRTLPDSRAAARDAFLAELEARWGPLPE